MDRKKLRATFARIYRASALGPFNASAVLIPLGPLCDALHEIGVTGVDVEFMHGTYWLVERPSFEGVDIEDHHPLYDEVWMTTRMWACAALTAQRPDWAYFEGTVRISPGRREAVITFENMEVEGPERSVTIACPVD